MGHGEEEHTAFDIAMVNGIVDGARSQAPFAACDFPGGLFHSLLINQLIVAFPAQDKTHPEPQPPAVGVEQVRVCDGREGAELRLGLEEQLAVITGLWEREAPYDIDLPDNRWKISTRNTQALHIGVGYLTKPYQMPYPEIVGTVVAVPLYFFLDRARLRRQRVVS